jgi:hypothetical protein
MPPPSLTPEQLAQVSGLVAQYIATQRENTLPHALPLDTKQRAAMDGFFLPEVLDGARLLVLGGIRVENPAFYPTLRGMGFENLPDFSFMSAITNWCMWSSIASLASRVSRNFTFADF